MIEQLRRRLGDAERRRDDAIAAALRLSGRHDGNRVARNAAPNLRWACHRSALRCAELLGVPRAPAHRRQSLAGLERNLQRSLGL